MRRFNYLERPLCVRMDARRSKVLNFLARPTGLEPVFPP
jgi:hypothetical protein